MRKKKSDYISASYDCYSKMHTQLFEKQIFNLPYSFEEVYLASSGSTTVSTKLCHNQERLTMSRFFINSFVLSRFFIFSTIFSKLIRNLFSHGTKGKILSYLDSFSRVIFEFDPMIFLQTFFSQCKQ